MAIQGQASYPAFYDLEPDTVIRIKRKPALTIKVLVWDSNDNLIRDHKRDFRKRDTRAWLNDVMYWAISNGHSIEIVNA